MQIAVVVGTRPEIIKMAPVIKALEKNNADFFIVHTGQHYSYNMDGVFFKQLELPEVNFKLEVGSGSHAEQTARVLTGVEEIFINEKPDTVLVEGDTNSVLAAALAASKLHIKVGHVEAGLRSRDRHMPEEINRILVDHCSDYLFAPTEISAGNLLSEGIEEDNVSVTGNTIVDALKQNIEIAKEGADVLNDLSLSVKNYCLVTIHRQENVDSRERFASILDGLDKLGQSVEIPVVYPVHPRAGKMMVEFGLKPVNLRLIEPQDYFSFIQLESNARLILTDSGGIQEEACTLHVPCVTLRDNTERPE
ncbi:non-hydrolyzing UDP-N-acetylglucosamine 2-epimerase, partial [Chloroflexota bacterium]